MPAGMAIKPDRTIPDISISWNAGLGSPVLNSPVTLAAAGAPDDFDPIAAIDGPYVDYLLSGPNSLIIDASETIDDGPNSSLTYSWDLDNDQEFEISTGNTPYLEVEDVSVTFGESGIYDIAVRVFDGENFDIAHTTIETIPEHQPAYAEYNPLTGRIVVSVDNLNGWSVRSKSNGLATIDPIESPSGGIIKSNGDGYVISEFTSYSGPTFSYYNFDLGEVASNRFA